MSKIVSVPDEAIVSKIYEIRRNKVMIDRDLSELFGVETRVLKQAVRRNIRRFPIDFMFEMTNEELETWRSQFVTSNEDKKGLRYAPFCFTEQGVTMLSCVLNSDRAIEVNIRIIRVFVQLKEMLLTHKDLLLKMQEIESKVSGQDEKIKQIFNYLRKFIDKEQKPRKMIGYKKDED
jgi:phage regulator Rha-like protein